MRRFLQVALALFAATTVVFALMQSRDANASVGYTSPYTYDQTYGTAMRLIRVDMGLSITEKDQDLGYVLFDYESPEGGGRATKGSIELIPRDDGVQVSVKLPAMPTYHERMLADALAKKLENEHGAPLRKKKSKADEDKRKGEKDKDKDKDKDQPDGDDDGNKPSGDDEFDSDR